MNAGGGVSNPRSFPVNTGVQDATGLRADLITGVWLRADMGGAAPLAAHHDDSASGEAPLEAGNPEPRVGTDEERVTLYCAPGPSESFSCCRAPEASITPTSCRTAGVRTSASLHGTTVGMEAS